MNVSSLLIGLFGLVFAAGMLLFYGTLAVEDRLPDDTAEKLLKLGVLLVYVAGVLFLLGGSVSMIVQGFR